MASVEEVVEARIARLESDVSHIRSDISDIKADLHDEIYAEIRSLREDHSNEFRKLNRETASIRVLTLVLVLGSNAAILSTMARGFGWI